MFKNNRASGTWGRDQYGGAIYCTNLKCNNCTFEDNYSNDDAGAIYIHDGDKTEIRNSKFIRNNAELSGGAIYCGTITCNNCTFENNKAKKYAGAIYINDKEVSTIKNSKFINNTSPFNGGAINIDDNSAHVVIKNNSFKGNTVDKDGEGSIIYNYGHFDKISNNYYGTNNPDWKNTLYEHKYFGLDVEHRDSNPVKL